MIRRQRRRGRRENVFFFLGIFATARPSSSSGSAKEILCNICRESPEGQPDRVLADPSNQFTVENSKGEVIVWTCGDLQQRVAVFDPNSGNDRDRFYCTLAQSYAENECLCIGPDIPPINSKPLDPNPACILCDGNFDYEFVPTVNMDVLVKTQIGTLSCGGLQKAMAAGVWAPHVCPIMREYASTTCCNLPAIDETDLDNNFGEEESKCVGRNRLCSTSNPCCNGLECKTRIIGENPICIVPRNERRDNLSLAIGRGGAAKGNAKNRKKNLLRGLKLKQNQHLWEEVNDFD